jgi:hypothetical protein
MSERETHWTEEMLLGLQPFEHDFQEFKGARFLTSEEGGVSSFFVNAISKQISAFANGAGGRLFIGIDDDGRIDGGVPVDLKGGGTRAWLEDIVTDCVGPPIRGFNVFEVRPRTDSPSRIHDGCAVYVIEIPSSDDAPHQAKDHRYYLRIAGKSRPMGHVHIQDVLRRTFHPRVIVSRVDPYGEPDHVMFDPRGPKVFVSFRLFVRNEGRVMARHVGTDVELPRPLVGREVRALNLEGEGVHWTQTPGHLTFFRYHQMPLFPTQEIFFTRFWIGIHANNAELVRGGDGGVSWRVYADDAPPVEGFTPFVRFAVVRRALAWLDEVSPKSE